jgi:EmrB/QacA subfamily drug resistance transporter
VKRISSRWGDSPWVPFAVISGGLFMMLLDSTVLNVAQSDIRASLGASLSGIQWTVDVYLLVLTICLLACGRLGDIFGRRRVFVTGIAIFTVASTACALAGPAERILGLDGMAVLIAARLIQGIGAAAVLSQTLSLIAVAFPPERRGAAFGTASAIGALAGIVGPLGGGFLTSRLSWEWIFLINLPFGIVVLLASRTVPESRDPLARRRIDFPAIALSGAALFAMAFGLIESGHRGWSDLLVVGLLAAGTLLAAIFVHWQRRATDPILRLELFSISSFRIGNVAMALFNIGFHGLSLPLIVFLQNVRGLDPVEAGFVMAPSAASMALTATIAGRLSDRFGPRWIMAGGFATMAAGVAYLAIRMEATTSPREVAAVMAVIGLGVGLTVSQANTVPMRAVPTHLTGASSGVLNTTRTAAVTVGVALMTSLLQQQTANRAEDVLVHAPLSSATRESAMSAVSEGRFDELTSLGSGAEQAALASLGEPLRNAFAGGMSIVLLVSVVTLVAGIGIALTLPSRAAIRFERGRELVHAPAGD